MSSSFPYKEKLGGYSIRGQRFFNHLFNIYLSQGLLTVSAVAASPGVECSAIRTAVVHISGKKVGRKSTAQENEGSHQDLEDHIQGWNLHSLAVEICLTGEAARLEGIVCANVFQTNACLLPDPLCHRRVRQ